MKNLNLKEAFFVAMLSVSLFASQPITSFLGTNEFSDERYLFNAFSYSHGNDRNSKGWTNNRLMKKLAIMSCIETVLMRGKNTNYILITTKLNSLYNCTISDCYENPEYLRTVLKDVYKEDYHSIIDDIKLELGQLAEIEEEKAKFFKIMES